MTKLDQMKQRVAELKNKAREVNDNPSSTLEDVQNVSKELNIAVNKLQTEELLIQNKVKDDKTGKKIEGENDAKAYKKAFFNLVRNKVTQKDKETIALYNKMTGNTDEDGGYLIPADIETRINEYKRELFSFADHTVPESVKTRTGRRVYEIDAEHTPFQEINEEGDELEELDGPKFKVVTYNIKDYGGVLPIPNSLKEDTDAALEEHIAKWLAKKEVATENWKVVEIIKKQSKLEAGSIDDLIEVKNGELDMVFEKKSKFFMSQKAYNYLSKEKDANGNSRLQTDPSQPGKKTIDGVEVVKVPNKILPTTGKKETIIVGAMDEFVKLYNRKKSIDWTAVGGNAWRTNTTEARAIMRIDAQLIDDEAAKVVQIDISKPQAQPTVHVTMTKESEAAE